MQRQVYRHTHHDSAQYHLPRTFAPEEIGHPGHRSVQARIKHRVDQDALRHHNLGNDDGRQGGDWRVLQAPLRPMWQSPRLAGDEEKTLKLLKHLKRLLAPKGFILGDSTDVLYRTMNADMAFEIGESYHGNVEFELTYKRIKADKFNWIYLDPALLAELCDKAGLTCEIIYRDDNFHYLAKLRKA